MTAPQKIVTPKPLPKIADYGPNAIDVKDLTFGYNKTGNHQAKTILHNLNLTLKTGSRCLLM